MFRFIQDHQMNIMLGMSSICFIVGVFAAITRSLPKQRKLALVDIEFAAGILLFSDRLAYMYHGDPSRHGYWMVRISNFFVFFMTVSVVHALNLYIADLCRNEIRLEKVPLRLRIVEMITAAGWLMVIISQFTGLYYTFDENNSYQRGPGFVVCYLIPFIALFIQLSVVLQYFRRLSLYISIPMLLFTLLPMAASLIQAFNYGISFTNMTIVGMGVVLYIFAIIEMNKKLERAQKEQLDEAQDFGRSVLHSYEQTISAIAKAIDSKDRFTKGHTIRVADYSREIAQVLGMDMQTCYQVYYSALLYNVGKIMIPDSVLLNKGRLTDAENEMIRNIPTLGGEILSEVDEIPFLGDAAQNACERYDGKGYPAGLQGEAIPLAARIVAVANAYDDMTSFKPNRPPLAQGKVREMLKNASGREFDPAIVDAMVDMIDKDTDYQMRENLDEKIEEDDKNDISVINNMHFVDYKETVSDGIRISRGYLKINFETRPDAGFERKNSLPALILFDSFDRCVHKNERNIKNFHYLEFGEIWMDGHTICTSARDIRSEINMKGFSDAVDEKDWVAYEIEAVSIKDHVEIKINNSFMHVDVTVALPDASRYVFLGITGEHCSIKNITVKEIALNINEDPITRIAPEVNHFTRKDGDIPNVEVNAYRDANSVGFPVEDGMRLFFRTQTLPVASLVNHCAYILIYTSDDGLVHGKNYVEYACIRTDGDNATENEKADNKLIVHRDAGFAGWDIWKERYKKGLDYTVEFGRKKNRITFKTENAGIGIECTTTVPKGLDNVYAALTGNLCTLMNIKLR